MKKEIEIELGVFVPLQKETADVPRALKNAGEILRQALCGSYFPIADTQRKEGKQMPVPQNGSAEVNPMADAPKSARAASPMSLDAIIRGQVLPENRIFRTRLSVGAGDRQTLENTVLEQVSLQLADRQETLAAGMEATLKIQKKILRAVQSMYGKNTSDMQKTPSAEGGVL